MSGFESLWVAVASLGISFGAGIMSEVIGPQCRVWKVAGFMGGG